MLVPVVWRERAGAPMLQVQLPVHDPFTLFQLGIFKSNKAGGWGSGGCGPQYAASLGPLWRWCRCSAVTQGVTPTVFTIVAVSLLDGDIDRRDP